MSKRITDILGGLDKLLQEQKELFEALPRAIRIAQIWPDAFKDGLTCKPYLIGVFYPSMGFDSGYPEPYKNLRKVKRTYLTRKDGVEHDISTEDFFSIISAGPE